MTRLLFLLLFFKKISCFFCPYKGYQGPWWNAIHYEWNKQNNKLGPHFGVYWKQTSTLQWSLTPKIILKVGISNVHSFRINLVFSIYYSSSYCGFMWLLSVSKSVFLFIPIREDAYTNSAELLMSKKTVSQRAILQLKWLFHWRSPCQTP